MKKKTYKLSKMEKNRQSLFTDNLSTCIVCDRNNVSLHEIYFGKNRQNSIKYNLVIPLCIGCHYDIHNRNHNLDLSWKIKGQIKFEEIFPELDFLDIFKKNYL